MLDGLMTVDIVATSPTTGQRTFVEVDGPTHFLRVLASPHTPGPSNGSHILRQRLQEKCLDGRAVNIPYYEWDPLGKEERLAYLKSR